MTMPDITTRPQAPELWQAYAKANAVHAELVEKGDAAPKAVRKREIAEKQVEAIRNDLVETYLPLVRSVAERVAMRVPRGVDLDDMMIEGSFGLMHAIGGFDPAREVRFETFAALRIRGAILDYLRSIDWIPRLPRMRQRQVDQVTAAYFHEHGRTPTDGELLPLLPGKKHEARRVLDDGRLVQMGSLEARQAMMHRDHDTRSAVEIPDPSAVSPPTASHRKMLQDYIGRELSRSERLILILNYYEGLTLAEVGKVLKISESRVSQIRTSILDRLRARFTEGAAVAQF
ncbi:MAG: FliA/WhiG family RNA polymerase sigma factor [Phycisphaeraceae bacterium]